MDLFADVPHRLAFGAHRVRAICAGEQHTATRCAQRLLNTNAAAPKPGCLCLAVTDPAAADAGVTECAQSLLFALLEITHVASVGVGALSEEHARSVVLLLRHTSKQDDMAATGQKKVSHVFPACRHSSTAQTTVQRCSQQQTQLPRQTPCCYCVYTSLAKESFH